MAKTQAEPRVTTEDLQRKWENIEDALNATAQQKVAGLSQVAVAGIVLGIGALGLAFWLGRRSAAAAPSTSGRLDAGEAAFEAEAPRPAQHAARPHDALNQILNPVIGAAVKSAVNALGDRLYKPSCEARL